MFELEMQERNTEREERREEWMLIFFASLMYLIIGGYMHACALHSWKEYILRK